jgi:hypothetical protein
VINWWWRVRQTLAGRVGLRTATGEEPSMGFPLIDQAPGIVVTGMDDKHLDFRMAVVIDPSGTDPRLVWVVTLVRVHNRLGRVYWAVVRFFHPPIVKAMLRRVPVAAAGVENGGS